MQVTILHSAIAENAGPDEQDTLAQVTAVQAALNTLGAKVNSIPFSLDLAKLSENLRKSNPTLVFNLVESINGKNQLIHWVPSLLEYLNIPFTGGDAQALFTSSDKILAKRLLQAAEIFTPPWFELEALTPTSFPTDGPYLVKSVLEDGSIGLAQDSFVNDYNAFVNVLNDRCNRWGGRWFAERYIPGREFNISILAGEHGPQVLPIAEIQFNDLPKGQFAILDYAAKWCINSIAYQNTPRHFNFSPGDHPLLDKLAKLGLTCWRWFKATGYARVDVRVDNNGQIWVLELNVNPCLTPDAGFVAAAAEMGLEYVALVKQIVEDALRH